MIESCDELGIDSVRNGDPRRIVPSQASVSLLPRSAMVTKKKKIDSSKKRTRGFVFVVVFFYLLFSRSYFSDIFRHFLIFFQFSLFCGRFPSYTTTVFGFLGVCMLVGSADLSARGFSCRS